MMRLFSNKVEFGVKILPSFIHSFIPSFSIMCQCNSQSPHSSAFFFLKLFTVGVSGGPIRNCGQVPGKQDPSTLKSLFASLLFTPVLSQEFFLKVFGKHWWKKKKRLWGKKNNKSFLSHPHPICCGIIISYYLQIMCTDMISTVWSGGHCGGCSCCFFVCEALWYTVGWGGFLPHVHLIVHSGPS